MSYQWQRLPAGGGTWANVTGANYSGGTTPTLTAASQALGNSGDQFRCVIVNVARLGRVYRRGLDCDAAGLRQVLHAGRYHSLRLNIVAQPFVAGTNTFGQLGTGNTSTITTPQPVILPGQTVVDLAAGGQHSFFLTGTKELWVTGSNSNGQLGDGTLVAKSTPFKIAGNVAGLAGGVTHSAYLATDGTLWTVGSNDSGQLGDGTTTDRATPVQVASGSGRPPPGRRASPCSQVRRHALQGVGDMNGSGVAVSAPVQIAANVAALSKSAPTTACSCRTDGTLWSMGYNGFGQLGERQRPPIQLDPGADLPRA